MALPTLMWECLLFLLNGYLTATQSASKVETPEATPLVNMFAMETSNNPSSSHSSLESSSAVVNNGNRDSVGTELVPYKPCPVLPLFQEERRMFKFVDKEWTVHQRWNDVGLASVVWEAALLLSQYLEILGESALKGKRIIELGAGTGLVGFVASALGAESIVLTDKTTGPAEVNLVANKHNLAGKNITVVEFEWGTDPSHLKPPFDIILAADVIYIEDTFPLLLQSLAELSDLKTVILISCKRRYERDDRFFDLLRKSGKFSYRVLWSWPKESKQPENDVKVYEVLMVS